MCGRQFYVVPTTLIPDLIPLRIDVYTPDQEQHPEELRDVLQSSFSVCMRHPRLSGLGISRHLCRALDFHCGRDSDFMRDYHRLPFGSKLVFENIAADVRAMRLTIVPTYDLERQFLSVKSIQKLWEGELPIENWPETIDISRLRLKNQLHDSVSLVTIKNESSELGGEDLIFKSSTNGPTFIYHELKFLLTKFSHANMMKVPIYVVTKRSSFGGKHGMCGFVLPYYRLGSIRDILPQRALSASLTLRQQLRWSKQIVSSLIYIREVAETFYSDLRPDNVLLSDSEVDDDHEIILCDFEQRGNWHEWCAPEVLYSMYADNIRNNPAVAAPSFLSQNFERQSWHNDLMSILSNTQSLRPGPHGSNPAWFSLSTSTQEKAQVFSLGLFLYCIFEGMSNPRVSLANAWPCEPHLSFPKFRSTPTFMREIIRKCTADAPEWESPCTTTINDAGPCRGQYGVDRVDGRLYPGHHVDMIKITDDISEVISQSVFGWWESEISRARAFFERRDWHTGDIGKNRPTLRGVLFMLNDAELGDAKHQTP